MRPVIPRNNNQVAQLKGNNIHRGKLKHRIWYLTGTRSFMDPIQPPRSLASTQITMVWVVIQVVTVHMLTITTTTILIILTTLTQVSISSINSNSSICIINSN